MSCNLGISTQVTITTKKKYIIQYTVDVDSNPRDILGGAHGLVLPNL